MQHSDMISPLTKTVFLDGFNGKLKSSKWATIAKCSADTALRDLIENGILVQEMSGGSSTNYELIPKWGMH